MVLERTPEVLLGGEADLIAPVAMAGAMFVSAEPHPSHLSATLMEVPCEYGVIDVVHVMFDATELQRRADLGLAAVPERRLLLTLRALNARGGQAAVSVLADDGRVSAERLRTLTGPALEERGWIRTHRAGWELIHMPGNPVARLVAVEIKQKDIGRGLAQARRYSGAAAHVALAVGPAARTQRARPAFMASGVGLARVEDGRVEILCAPATQPDIDPLSRALLAEQVLHMREVDVRSGPVRPVFGRLLLSAGRDPRLGDAPG